MYCSLPLKVLQDFASLQSAFQTHKSSHNGNISIGRLTAHTAHNNYYGLGDPVEVRTPASPHSPSEFPTHIHMSHSRCFVSLFGEEEVNDLTSDQEPFMSHSRMFASVKCQRRTSTLRLPRSKSTAQSRI